MREIRYSQIRFGERYFEITDAVKELIESIADKLMVEYSLSRADFNERVLNANVHLQYLTAVLGDIKGKRVLDLGCGSCSFSPDFGIENFLAEPWLCRILYALGNNPVGIDIRSLDGEEFEYHSSCLLIPDSLAILPDSCFDVIHSRSLFDSPGLLISRGSDSGYLMYQR